MLCKWFKSRFKKKIKTSAKKTEPTLCIIVGHDCNKKGAWGAHPINAFEYTYNVGLAILIKEHAKKAGITCEIVYRDIIGISGAYREALEFNPSAIIELHFNAYNGKVEGCETLYTDKKDKSGIQEKALAGFLQDRLCKVMDNKNRGLKHLASNGEAGFYNLSRVHSVPSVIIEPFFGDNPREARKAVERENDLAKAVVESYQDFLKLIS